MISRRADFRGLTTWSSPDTVRRAGPIPIRHSADFLTSDFVVEINRRYGSIPPEILTEPDILGLLLPPLRADFAALETRQSAGASAARLPDFGFWRG